MAKDLKRLTDFLIEQSIDRIGHTNKTYLAHLVGLYHLSGIGPGQLQ